MSVQRGLTYNVIKLVNEVCTGNGPNPEPNVSPVLAWFAASPNIRVILVNKIDGIAVESKRAERNSKMKNIPGKLRW